MNCNELNLQQYCSEKRHMAMKAPYETTYGNEGQNLLWEVPTLTRRAPTDKAVLKTCRMLGILPTLISELNEMPKNQLCH